MYNGIAPVLLRDAQPISEQCLPSFSDHDTTWSGLSWGQLGSPVQAVTQPAPWWVSTALCQLSGRKLTLSQPKP